MREPNWEALECFDASRKPRQSPPVAQYEVVKNYKRLKKYCFRIRRCRHGFTLFFSPYYGADPPVEEKIEQWGARIDNWMRDTRFRPFYNGMWVEVLGKPYKLRAFAHDRGRDEIKGRMIRLYQCSSRPREIRDRLSQFLRDFAKPWLIRRFYELADEHGFEGQSVRIGDELQRQWGYHWYGQHKTNLPYTVIQLPLSTIDYLIIHELCHSRVHGHGQDFWQEVARHANPGWQNEDAFLSRVSTMIRYGLRAY